MKIPTGKSESVYLRTDNTKRKEKGQFYKLLYGKLENEKHESLKKRV